MKRNRLIQLACLAAVTVSLMACSQDELLTSAEGAGTAVTFTATGIAMPQVETRATVDGTWDDALSVAIKIGSEVKEYTATPNDADSKTASLAAAEGVMPFYWRYSTETKDVQAWYPYNDGETSMPAEVVVQQDQSIEANYLASDLLSASGQVSYGNTALTFEHRTAKITLKLQATPGSTVSLEKSQVLLYNLSTTNGKPTNIYCYRASDDGNTHHALVAPQTFDANKEFLKLILADGAVHNYVSDASIEFKAGYQYVFTITLTDTGMKVTVGEAIPWDDEVSSENGIEVIETDDYYIYYGANGQRHYYVKTEAGLKVWAEYTNQGNWGTNLTLMNNITMTKPEDGSSNWTPIGYRSDGKYSDKYAGTIEGNGYTIDNMVVNTFSSNFAAMIVTLSGTVQNLTIGSGSYFHAKYWSASVTTNVNGGKVINCHSAATVNLTLTTAASWGDGSIGGIVANNRGDDGNSYVIGCSFSGQLTADAGSITESIFVGGVVGSSWTTGNGNDVQVIGCLSSGEVTLKNSPASAQTHVGGIVGSCYKNGDDITRVASCAMTGKVKFDNVYKRSAEYSAFDAGVGHLYNSPSAMYVYWSDGSIEDTWRNPYRSTTYSSVLEVNGTDIDWATATERMNSYIASWNSSWGNRCTVHFEQTGNNPPTLVQGKP